MANLFIPNPIAALPPSRALFPQVPPAQTGEITAQFATQAAGLIGQGIQGFRQAKSEKANLAATADFLDARGNSAAADLFRAQAENINPFFSTPAGSGGSRGSSGGAFGSSGLVRDILRHDLTLDEIGARHQADVSLENLRTGNENSQSALAFRRRVFENTLLTGNQTSTLKQWNGEAINQARQNGIFSAEEANRFHVISDTDPQRARSLYFQAIAERVSPERLQNMKISAAENQVEVDRIGIEERNKLELDQDKANLDQTRENSLAALRKITDEFPGRAASAPGSGGASVGSIPRAPSQESRLHPLFGIVKVDSNGIITEGPPGSVGQPFNSQSTENGIDPNKAKLLEDASLLD